MRSAESTGYRYTPCYPLTKESCERNVLFMYNDVGTRTSGVLAVSLAHFSHYAAVTPDDYVAMTNAAHEGRRKR